MKICLVQRVLLSYRIDLYSRIAKLQDIELIVLHGDDIAGTKFINFKGNIPFNHIQLKTLQYVQGTHKALIWYKHLWATLKKIQPDLLIIEGENNMINNIRINRWCQKNHRPFIWWSLGQIPNMKYTLYQKMYRPYLNNLLNRAGAIIGYSTYTKSYYESLHVDGKKIFVCNNCLDYTVIKREIEDSKAFVTNLENELRLSGKVKVLFVGNLEKRKRVDLLLDVAESLPQENLSFIIVGDGSDKSRLENMAKEKGLSNVIFTGSQTKYVSRYFLLADIFVLPGLGGLAIYQAMVHGLPIICGPADGTERDLIKGNGILLDIVNQGTLLNAIKTLLQDPGLRKEMGKESLRIVEEEVNQEKTVAEILRAIEYASIRHKSISEPNRNILPV